MYTFATQLRRELDQRNMTTRHLATALGWSEREVAKWLAGGKKIPDDTLLHMLQALGMTRTEARRKTTVWKVRFHLLTCPETRAELLADEQLWGGLLQLPAAAARAIHIHGNSGTVVVGDTNAIS